LLLPAQYAAVFIGSVLLSLILTPLALRVAVRRGFLDHPGGYKTQHAAVPYLGGGAMVVAFATVVGGLGTLLPLSSGKTELVTVLGLGCFLAIVGLIDDLRGLGPAARVVSEIAASVGLVLAGAGASTTGIAWLDACLTVIWVVAITNAVNLLDNMDGLSAGVCAIAAASLFVLAAVTGQFLVASLSVAVSGVSLGFLRHNVVPARIYMGDSGALFLGFMLAYLSLKLELTNPPSLTWMVPVLVLGVALLDTLVVTVSRIAHGQNPFSGGRDHISHRLVFVGVPVRATVALLYVAAIAAGWLGLVVSRLDRATAVILIALLAAVTLFVGVLLSMVPIYENSKRRRLMIQAVREHEADPEGSAGQP
jgi:UDP-GlcNAc:undecaprenyl-phosphate/decaprenyl-phosphate GlcNAc-1-phosphate transferase